MPAWSPARFNQADLDIGVAALDLGARTGLMRGIHDRLDVFALSTWKLDVQASAEAVIPIAHAEACRGVLRH